MSADPQERTRRPRRHTILRSAGGQAWNQARSGRSKTVTSANSLAQIHSDAGLAGTNTSGPRPRRRQCRPPRQAARSALSPVAPRTSRPASPTSFRSASPGMPRG